ncbi:MAG: 2Fe-2S iron-sulfur cluster binding domain-containing protein [Candidatus Thiodiazotropha sp.]
MFFFRAKKKQAVIAQINGEQMTVEPEETLLQAALRQGAEFPHSCRIGACGACKCRLVEGQVKNLTDITYTLSNAEIANGYILACQCLPESDVRIEVDQTAVSAVSGRIIGQARLTPDITELRVQLEESLAYKAGQFGDISVAALPHVQRSYSFATPAQPNGQVRFFVRRIPGGVFSSYINDTDVMGQAVTVEGPKGEFWLRPAETPLLFVAGGSGLAPILALLQEACNARVMRSTTLIFGARQQADLYALDEIEKIASQWETSFRFVPVLSEEESSSWRGRRGMAASLIPEIAEPGVQAYLCGPPPMVDSAEELLAQSGVPPQHIYTDRFIEKPGL